MFKRVAFVPLLGAAARRANAVLTGATDVTKRMKHMLSASQQHIALQASTVTSLQNTALHGAASSWARQVPLQGLRYRQHHQYRLLHQSHHQGRSQNQPMLPQLVAGLGEAAQKKSVARMPVTAVIKRMRHMLSASQQDNALQASMAMSPPNTALHGAASNWARQVPRQGLSCHRHHQYLLLHLKLLVQTEIVPVLGEIAQTQLAAWSLTTAATRRMKVTLNASRQARAHLVYMKTSRSDTVHPGLVTS